MRFLRGLLVGIILGAVGYWFVQEKARQHPETEQRVKDSAARAGAAASEAAHNFSDAFKAEMDTLDLRPDQIKDEMTRTGKIVRRRAQEIAGQVADATADARIVTEIKAKYVGDSDLSVWSISVSSHEAPFPRPKTWARPSPWPSKSKAWRMSLPRWKSNRSKPVWSSVS
jgi:hypothetical protein